MATNISAFMKEMTEATGLYGEELFDFIREKCLPQEKKQGEKADIRPTKEIARFYGDRFAAVDYLATIGAAEKTVKLFKASSYEFRAAILAAEARAERFEWTCPITVLKPNGFQDIQDRTFVGFWDAEKEIYSFY